MSTSTFSTARSEVICRAHDPATCKYHGTISKLNDAIAAEDFEEYQWLRDENEKGRQEEIKAFQAEVAHTEKRGLRSDKDVLNYLVREAERGMQEQNRLLGDTPDGEDPFNEGYRAAYVVLANRLHTDADAARKPSVLARPMTPKAAAIRAVKLLKAKRESYFTDMPATVTTSISPESYREGYVEAVNQFIMDYDGKGIG